MKFAPTVNKISSTTESTGFRMAINAKSFSILTSGIYQDKIKAVIREYSTNALESHIQAKNEQPFEVHLPTEDECYFYVRDYGVGLTDEEFENVFCTFFQSSKDNTNDLGGCLGLGAKVGHSYNTKSYIVESWKDGYHYIYNCFIGVSGVPERSQLLKEYSQDTEGVKIQIAVDQDDINEFKQTAHEVYKWFSLKPKFIGEQLEIESPIVSKYENYSITNDGCYAIMGNIAYPIDHNYSLETYKDIINSKICLHFNIGEISFNPSRESLEYSDRTLANLKKKFKLVIEEAKTNIENQIKNCKSEWEAICEFNSISKFYGGIKNINKYIGEKCIYGDKELSRKAIELPCIYFPGYKNGSSKQHVALSKNNKYVINDLKIGSLCRCRELSKNCEVYLLNQQDLQNIEITYTDDCFIYASSLPKPARTYTYQSRSKLTSFMKVENHRLKTNAYTPAEVDKATSKMYIVRKGYNVIYDNQNTQNIGISPKELYRILQNAGIKEDIYSVSQKEEKNLLKLGFRHIREVVEESIEKDYTDFMKDIDFYNRYRSLFNFKSSNYEFFTNLIKYKKHVLPTSKLNELLELLNYLDINSTKYNSLNSLHTKLHSCGKTIQFSPFPVDNYLTTVKMYEMLSVRKYYDQLTDSCYQFYLKGIDS